MFNFLNSAVLIAAAAALIPLLIHLFSKRKVKVVEFSSLRHLKEMQKRQVRRLKIRQILLLLLRMLIILTAVLAFARPASKGGYVGSHAGVSAVILLDKSASMQRQVKDGRLYDLAKRAAADILGNFGEADELLLIPFDRQTYFPAGERFFSRDIAEKILNETEPGYDTGILGQAYNQAARLLNSAHNLNKELYLITDRQASSLPETADTAASGMTVYFVDLPLETDGNCGIIGVDLGGQLIEVGSDFTVRAPVKNYDNFSKSEVLASLFLDNLRVVQSELKLNEKAKETIAFKSTVQKPSFHYGWVELSDDGFLPDNKFYFSFQLPEQFNVLIVDGDNSGELLKLALVPSEKLARYWSVKMTDPSQLASLKLRDYNVIVLAGVDRLAAVESSRLLTYVDNGGGLFIIAGAAMHPAAFNQNFGNKMGVKYLQPPPASFSGTGYYTLERFDYTHPIFKAFDNFRKDSLPVFRFFALPQFEDNGPNRDLAYFSGGLPALIESGYGLGKIIMMTAPIIPRYTDIASHSFFVPFVIRTMVYLSGDVGEFEIDNFVGENVMRSISSRRTIYGTVTMVTPDGRSYEIAGTEQPGQVVYDCRPIDQPGIYQLRSGDKLVDIFPVNLTSAEGDLAAADMARFETALGIEKSRTIPYNKSSAALISEARFGRELWKIFLWAAILIMAVEMVFARESKPDPEEQ
nr:VWA domain-containing protein [candidate division Zixibacteria bacterium]